MLELQESVKICVVKILMLGNVSVCDAVQILVRVSACLIGGCSLRPHAGPCEGPRHGWVGGGSHIPLLWCVQRAAGHWCYLWGGQPAVKAASTEASRVRPHAEASAAPCMAAGYSSVKEDKAYLTPPKM